MREGEDGAALHPPHTRVVVRMDGNQKGREGGREGAETGVVLSFSMYVSAVVIVRHSVSAGEAEVSASHAATRRQGRHAEEHHSYHRRPTTAGRPASPRLTPHVCRLLHLPLSCVLVVTDCAGAAQYVCKSVGVSLVCVYVFIALGCVRVSPFCVCRARDGFSVDTSVVRGSLTHFPIE